MLTSKMRALIHPERWGLTVIDRWFGVYRPRANQSLVLSGDIVRDQKGHVHRFAYRQGDQIFMESV